MDGERKGSRIGQMIKYDVSNYLLFFDLTDLLPGVYRNLYTNL